MRPREVAALLALAAIWGASFLFIRIAAPALGPFPLMAGRVVLAAAVLWGYAAVRGTRVVLRPWAGKLLLLGLLHAAAPFSLIAAAEVHLPASTAAVLLAVQPLCVTLLGVAFLGERLSAARGAGLLLGLAGVWALVGSAGAAGLQARSLLSAGAVLLAALLYAGGSLYARHRMEGVPVLTLALGQQLGAAAWLVVPAFVTAPAASWRPGPVAALVALALLSTAVAYVLFFWLIGRVGALKASTVTYAIPVFGVIWGAIFLGEPLTPGIVTGLGCILLSLTMLYDRRSESPRSDVRASVPDSRTSTREPSDPAEAGSLRGGRVRAADPEASYV